MFNFVPEKTIASISLISSSKLSPKAEAISSRSIWRSIFWMMYTLNLDLLGYCFHDHILCPFDLVVFNVLFDDFDEFFAVFLCFPGTYALDVGQFFECDRIIGTHILPVTGPGK